MKKGYVIKKEEVLGVMPLDDKGRVEYNNFYPFSPEVKTTCLIEGLRISFELRPMNMDEIRLQGKGFLNANKNWAVPNKNYTNDKNLTSMQLLFKEVTNSLAEVNRICEHIKDSESVKTLNETFELLLKQMKEHYIPLNETEIILAYINGKSDYKEKMDGRIYLESNYHTFRDYE